MKYWEHTYSKKRSPLEKVALENSECGRIPHALASHTDRFLFPG